MFTCITDVRTPAVEWLWPNHLALGHLHLLDGDLDRGKSLLVCDLAARISTGRAWPDGASGAAASSVLVCSSEDEPGLVRARLLAAGAEAARSYVWNPPPGSPPLRLPEAIADLNAALVYTGARLLILDPIFAHLPAQCALGSDPAMRAALSPLAALARERRCAILMIRHLRKTAADQALYRGLGSIALAALCRLVWIVGPDREHTDRFGLAVAKNNLGPTPPSLSYSLSAAADGSVASLTWHGPSPWTAEALVGRRRHGLSRLTADQLLTEMLATGPCRSCDIERRAKRHRLPMAAVRDAAEKLDIRYQRVGNASQGQKTYWVLPGQSAPGRTALDDEIDAAFRRAEEHARGMGIPMR